MDYLICDEAQFYTPAQVEQLARVVDEMAADVFAFGITADFRTRLFPGSQRLLELADRVQVLQVEVLCRRHHLRRMTAIAAHAGALSPDTLPFDPAPAAADVPAAEATAADVPGAVVPRRAAD